VAFAPPVHRHDGYRTPEQRRKAEDERRGNARSRGYDRTWESVRREFLAQHPLCECDEHKGKDFTAFSQVVDHRQSIAERPDLRLEWSNLRAMTKRCHDKRTAKEQGFAMCGVQR